MHESFPDQAEENTPVPQLSYPTPTVQTDAPDPIPSNFANDLASTNRPDNAAFNQHDPHSTGTLLLNEEALELNKPASGSTSRIQTPNLPFDPRPPGLLTMHEPFSRLTNEDASLSPSASLPVHLKSSVLERLRTLSLSDELADVWFVVGHEPEVERLPGHQLILSLSSPVFHTMFHSQLSFSHPNSLSPKNPTPSREHTSQEGIEGLRDTGNIVHADAATLGSPKPAQPVLNDVRITDIEPDAFKVFLKGLYTDVADINEDNVMQLLYAARKYQVPLIERQCFEFCQQSLNADNVFLMLEQALLYENNALADVCYDMIDRDAEACFHSEYFVQISLETLQTVVKRDTLSIREVKILEAIVRWAVAQCSKENITANPSNIRYMLRDTLDYIRFPLYVSHADLISFAIDEFLRDQSNVLKYLYRLSESDQFS